MKTIGEKLNSSVPSTLAALNARDEASLVSVIRRQAECGADFLDINTALCGEQETELMKWVVGLALKHSDCGIMLDSPNPDVITACLPQLKGRAAMINSVSLDGSYDGLLAAAKEAGAGVVCLPIEGKLIPPSAQERLENANKLVQKLEGMGFARGQLYIDALVEAIATNGEAGRAALETMQMVSRELPGVNTICGLSNVSFGLPKRACLNAAFLAMALQSGLTAAILDVTSTRIRETLAASAALLGEDEYCMEYIGYHRANG